MWEIDYLAEIRRAATVQAATSDVRWVPLERYSSRQDRRIAISVIIGESVFEGGEAPRFMDLLRLGAVVHVGKGAVFGQGEIEVAAMPETGEGPEEPSKARGRDDA